MHHLRFLVPVVLALHAGILHAKPAPLRPNIILSMADDLGWGDVSFNADTAIRTPCLAQMATAGMRFTRFYSAAPVCSPTRGSALTGRHPFRYGIFHANVGHLPSGEITLAEVLRDEGYATGHFGKWHLGTLTTSEKDSNRGAPGKLEHYSPPWKNGFQTCFSTEAKVPTWDPAIRPRNLPAGGKWWDPVKDPAEATPYGTAYWDEEGKKVTEDLGGDDSRVIMDRAITFIREASKTKKPFFAVIWFHAPHLPVVAGDRYTALYPDCDKYTRHYNGCVTALDEQMGRLRGELRELGVRKNTLLWFCADNGPEGQGGRAPGSAGPLRGRKRSLFEGGVRVPGLLEWPAKVKPGTVTDFPAVTSDYFPTVLEVLELEPEPGRPLDGVSLLPLIEGKAEGRSRPIGFESTGQLALTDNRYKLIRLPSGGKRRRAEKRAPVDETPFQLFDLAEDPGEEQDIASEHPALAKKMREALESWRKSCDASREGADYR